MKIGIGEWKTWNGLKAMVACRRPNTEYPWIGWLEIGGEPLAWSDEGHVKLGVSGVHNLETPWTSPIAKGHNPDKLTEEQVGEGCRLPEWDEIRDLQGGKKVGSLDLWVGFDLKWLKPDYGRPIQTNTYRTRLSREELAALSAQNKRLIRVEELPITVAIKCDHGIITNVIERDIQEQTLSTGDLGEYSITELIAKGWPWSSDLKTWNSFEVEEK